MVEVVVDLVVSIGEVGVVELELGQRIGVRDLVVEVEVELVAEIAVVFVVVDVAGILVVAEVVVG